MSDPFQRLQDSVFARRGQAAVLRGGTMEAAAVTVIIDKGVAMTGEHGEVVALRTMATLPASAEPRIGDTLTVDAIDYVLDSLIASDGYEARFFVRT